MNSWNVILPDGMSVSDTILLINGWDEIFN